MRILRLKSLLSTFNFFSFCTAFGGLLIFAYLLRLGFFPDFDLANLAGTFAAAALSAAAIVLTFSAFCLLPGAAARSFIANVPSVIDGPADAHVCPRPQWYPSHSSLEHPRFLASLTPIAAISWAWVFSDSLRQAYGANWQAALIGYSLMVVAAIGAIMCYGHPRRKKGSVISWSIFVGVLLFLVALFALSKSLPPAQPDKASVAQTSSAALIPIDENKSQWPKLDAEYVTRYSVEIASVPGFLGGALLMLLGIKKRRERDAVTRRPSPNRFRWIQYDGIKLCAAAVFVFLSLAIRKRPVNPS